MHTHRRAIRCVPRVLAACTAGVLTTLSVVMLGVWQGSPTIPTTPFTRKAFRTDFGLATFTDCGKSLLVTATNAHLVQNLSRTGEKPGTIEVLPGDPDFFSDRDLAAFRRVPYVPPPNSAVADATDSDLETLDDEADEQHEGDGPFSYEPDVHELCKQSPLEGATFFDKPEANSVMEFAIGFPFRACWTAEWCQWEHGACMAVGRGPSHWIAIPKLNSRKGWVPIESGFQSEFGFPTGILPLGFAANTTIYATAWFALLSVPGFIRRRFAKQKNTCPACSYNLQGLPTNASCPECGGQRTAH
ncbi:MAG: hypothetical protein U0640_02845 [Phycisphaerales bacterium]